MSCESCLLLTARAEAAEAKVIDTEAKCGQEIINLRAQLQAAEATVAHLRDAIRTYLSADIAANADTTKEAAAGRALELLLEELLWLPVSAGSTDTKP